MQIQVKTVLPLPLFGDVTPRPVLVKTVGERIC